MKDDYVLFRRKGQKIWYIAFYEGHKRIYKSTGKRLKYEAKQYADNLLKGTRKKEIILNEYAKDFFVWDRCTWIQRQHAKGKSFLKSTAHDRRAHLENYILPKFGHLYLKELNTVKIETWLLNLPLANQTKNHVLYSFNIILKEAKRERLINQNPIDDIEPLSRQAKKIDAFSVSELKKMFPENDSELLNIWQKREYAAMFLLMASSGIRLGEARALMWKHIAWQLGAIFILQAWKADKSLGQPKANEKRGIYIPARTLIELKKWQNESLFKGQDDLIFYGEGRDRPLNNKTIYDYFMAGIKKAEIDTKDRNLRPHSLRHTYNTMMRNILPETVLREFTGHRSESMTNHYDSRAFLEERLQKIKESKDIVNTTFNFNADNRSL